MRYQTNDGVTFHVLPDEAECTYVHKHPDNIEECPVCIAGDGSICIPESCEYYTENWNEVNNVSTK